MCLIKIWVFVVLAEEINIGQRSKSIAKRERSIDKKLAGKKDSAIQIAFTFYVIALAAKLARVDSSPHASSTAAEVDSFKEIFSIPELELDKVEEFYSGAVSDKVSAPHYARQLVNLFPNNRLLLEELVDDLLIFADADSPMTSGKINFLRDVVTALNFNDRFFMKVLRKHLLHMNPNPYTLLDVPNNVSYVDLKKKYRNAIKDCHPDKFAAPNVAPELVEIAKEQFNIYSKAYETVKQTRGFGRETRNNGI